MTIIHTIKGFLVPNIAKWSAKLKIAKILPSKFSEICQVNRASQWSCLSVVNNLSYSLIYCPSILLTLTLVKFHVAAYLLLL